MKRSRTRMPGGTFPSCNICMTCSIRNEYIRQSSHTGVYTHQARQHKNVASSRLWLEHKLYLLLTYMSIPRLNCNVTQRGRQPPGANKRERTTSKALI
eukprot:scaffold150677_cov33-Prasinocladus_malaysianus.AAC.1